MKRLATLSFCFLIATAILCQKNDYIWMSGAYIPSDDSSTDFTIDFGTFPPQIDKSQGGIMMSDANICMSNSEGHMIYYSNGCIIRTKNHELMENGEHINQEGDSSIYYAYCGPDGWGSYPVLQGIFALPFGDSVHELFHTRFASNPPGPNLVCNYDALLYSQIDMNANQGLGEVVFKDSILMVGCLQTACANRHANGRDWWVLLPDNVYNRFYRFLSTPEGIQGPWIQEIENPTIVDTFFYLGWSEFSPDGERFMINDVQSGTAIYDFDRCTGLLSHLLHLPDKPFNLGDPHDGWSAAFSPDGRFVYRVGGYNFDTIQQFDLEAADILASKTTVATWDGYYDYFEPNGPPLQASFSFFQHGPDGKLYNWAGGSRFMHIMDFPNRKGLDCHVRLRALNLPYYTFAANAYYPNYRLGPIDGSSCDTLSIDNHPVALFRHEVEDTLSPLQVTFTDLSFYEPTNWHWDFGDGTTSQDTSPVHIFPSAGTYNVCLMVSNQYAADTLCEEVTVGIIGTDAPQIMPHAQVFPNPVSNILMVRVASLGEKEHRFILTDILGRMIITTRLEIIESSLSTSHLSPGFYLWQLWSGNSLLQTGKLVKTGK